MIRGSRAFLAALILFAGCSVASAQDATIGAGKVEIGGFPGGGTFFVGGDDNKEVNFNVYTAGGGLTYYFNNAVAVEGEFTGSVGWAQDVNFNNAKLIHNQMPTVWSYSGNIVFFPGGTTGKQRAVLSHRRHRRRRAVAARADEGVRLRRRHGRHADVHRREHRRRHQAVPRRRRAELGLPHRLPLSVRQREQRRAGVLREVEEPRRPPHLRRHALHLETVGAHWHA